MRGGGLNRGRSCAVVWVFPHTQHSKETSMPLAGFEPAIPAREQPLRYVLIDIISNCRQFDYSCTVVLEMKQPSDGHV